jgi:transposase
MLLRLAYMGITNAFALLRLLPGSDRDKDAEILALRHQLAVLHRQLGQQRVRFEPAHRAWLAALLHRLPTPTLRLLVRPDTVLRWHRDLIARRRAAVSRPRRRGRPPTVRSIRALVLRLVAENPSWGYRRVHGELLTLGIKVAASTVWQILREAGIDPAPNRAATTWTDFLRSQAEALLAADFIETVTLAGVRMYVLASIPASEALIVTMPSSVSPRRMTALVCPFVVTRCASTPSQYQVENAAMYFATRAPRPRPPCGRPDARRCRPRPSPHRLRTASPTSRDRRCGRRRGRPPATAAGRSPAPGSSARRRRACAPG